VTATIGQDGPANDQPAGGQVSLITGVRVLRQQAPELEPLQSVLELSRRAADEASKLWADAGLGDEDRHHAGALLGSCYGTGQVNEYMSEFLIRHPTPRFHPDAFLHHAASAVAGRVCQQLGLGGAGTVILGLAGMTDALISASRSLLIGRHDVAVTGGFEWLSARAVALLTGAGAPVAHSDGQQVRIILFLVESAAHARTRSAVALADATFIPGWPLTATGRLDEVADRLVARASCDAVLLGDGPSALRVTSRPGQTG
jgi:hypothetical protein